MASRVGVACAICGVFCLPLTGGALYLLYAALAYDTVRLANRMALAAAAFLALIAMFLFLLHLMRMTRYRLDINGMTYTGFLGTKHWPWNQIAKARADTRKERLSSAGAPGEWVGLRVLRLETTDGRTHTTSLGAIGKKGEERLLELISLAAGRLEAMKPVLELEGELRERGLGRAAGTGVAVLLTTNPTASGFPGAWSGRMSKHGTGPGGSDPSTGSRRPSASLENSGAWMSSGARACWPKR